MIPVSVEFANMTDQRSQTPVGALVVQTATPDGSRAATQTVLGKVLAYRLTRMEDPSSDTCQLVLADDAADYLSTSSRAAYAALFQPGVIDTKFILYLGFEGCVFPQGGSEFIPYSRQFIQKFTGFIETDANNNQTFMLDKTVSLIDLTKQFRFPVNDTYPHPLYGDQTLSFFDPTYNLKPLNITSGMANQWQCDGRMFTQSAEDPIYGSSHIALAVYVDTTGGGSPSNTPVATSSYSFDYSNGLVTFGTAIPSNSVVSVAGNPTYMAPEVMVRKMLVELADWSPSFLALDSSNVLLPQFLGNGQSVWQCIKSIAAQTCPRFTPWQIWADENGFLRFYESRVDGPPVKQFLQGRNIISANYENTSRQLRTVVRADGTIYVVGGSGGIATASDQPIVSIAYDLLNIDKYGQTEPLELSQDVTMNVRPLGATVAQSYLNMLTTSVLAQVSRPLLSVVLEIWPDPSIQPGDKISITHDAIGMDRLFIVSQTEESNQGKVHKHVLTCEEFYDTTNYAMGAPSGVATTLAQASTTPPPGLAIVGAVRMGTGAHAVYPLQNGQYITDDSQQQVIPVWDVSSGAGMHFDYFLNSLPLVASASLPPPTNQWDYNHLPPGYGWATEIDPVTMQTVYYGTDPSNSYTTYVGPDSVFYEFNHPAPFTSADLTSIWVPPGNTAPVGIGGTQPYTGQTVTVYTWAWWYLALDSNLGTGKFFRPVQRVYAAQDAQPISITATGGVWMYNTWSLPPIPTASSIYYGNIVIGTDNHTTPPAGFVSNNVIGDGVQVGVAYGEVVPSGVKYTQYRKKTRGYFNLFACNSVGQRQFLKIPMDVLL